ncbi:FHA domain-containing protein [Zhihengliuella salsuginis]|uniref:FHA domain-containing protein n=1 Tax=Zhihengliuella salsuginis TaxID=578222 RepID=A0ABQ3GJJ3_9MICC|nr:FHA domain-containing protein [Zhihengliuella salsuginis]GHD08034.1 hypothetical protein GCM10008096_19450 [Zhihengliuella salsuginis]
MTGLRYLPGDWFALVRPGHVILLPGDVPGEDVARLWEEMGASATVESLLSDILGAADMKISSLPPFAIVSRDPAPHVVVRGSATVTATGPDGPERASGDGVATWQERRFQAAESWDVSVGGAGDGGDWLPIGEGIVRVDALSSGRDGRPGAGTTTPAAAAAPSSSAPEDDPEPVPAEPAPAPEREPAAPAPEPDPAPEAVAEPTSSPDAGESASGPEDDQDRDADSISLEQISLAGELLGRREADTGGHDAQAPAVEPADEAGDEPAAEDADDADTILVSRPAAGPSAPEPPAPAPADPGPAASPADSEMIDSVPWRTNPERPRSAPPSPPTPPQQPAPPVIQGRPSETGDGDHDGHTVMRSALPPEEPAAPAPSGPASGEPDDALTLTSHNTTPGATAGEFVLGRACGEGHANPPTSSSCMVCGDVLTGDAHQMMRPALGRMIVSDGGGQRESEHELTRSIVLGRQPSARSFTGDRQPRLMQVSSPSGDISRSHLQVRIDGWHVELVDLGATNGTVLIRPGQAPRRLGKSEAVLLLGGDVADLGDGVSLRFEDLP